MLNWLFYRPMFGNRVDRGDTNPWQEYWGESELKQQLLKPVLGKLESEEKIGNLIVDVGSGASPVSKSALLSDIEGKHVKITGRIEMSKGTPEIRIDAAEQLEVY